MTLNKSHPRVNFMNLQTILSHKISDKLEKVQPDQNKIALYAKNLKLSMLA